MQRGCKTVVRGVGGVGKTLKLKKKLCKLNKTPSENKMYNLPLSIGPSKVQNYIPIC